MKTMIKISYPALALFTLGCFALSPQARAACQEGCLINQNTVLGDDALLNNTTGSTNTAIGFNALLSNTIGDHNTAAGYLALYSNTFGGDNTANGYEALHNNSTGADNTANGTLALNSNNTGTGNTATGSGALALNTTGFSNTAAGVNALFRNTTGNSNIALGDNAGLNLTTGSDNIDIGNAGFASDFRTIRIGTKPTHKNTFIAGISGATVPAGIPVIVDANGHLGTTTSSARFKDEIKPMDKASEAILSLKPVTFRYKKDLDPDDVPQFGLVAEQVEKVNPELVAYDDDGKPYSVRYEAVNAMLLNEFLKEHRTVEELEATVARQREDFEAAIIELKGQIQKVNAQLEVSRFTGQTVAGNQ